MKETHFTTLEQALVLDGDGVNRFAGAYWVMSSAPTVAAVVHVGVCGGAYVAVDGLTEGTATITTTRNMDGLTASLTPTVTAGAGFTIQLGTPTLR